MSIEFDTFFLVCVNLSDIGEVLINEYIEEFEDDLQTASLFIGDDEDTEDSDAHNTHEEESIIKEELNTFFIKKEEQMDGNILILQKNILTFYLPLGESQREKQSKYSKIIILMKSILTIL